MTRRLWAWGLVVASLGSLGCAGAFLPRGEAIDLGPDRDRRVSVSVEGPEDMPEWGELLWGELVQALSASGVARVVEPAPGVLLVKATIDSWDYEERVERIDGNGYRARAATMPRQCSALMGVTIEIADPATGKVLAERKYLGVESDWKNDLAQMQLYNRFQTPKWLMRRAAKRVASQLADDLEAGRAPAPPARSGEPL
ncbi:MAG: hypothetical protein QM765_32030 [Myxococcales bacterium]